MSSWRERAGVLEVLDAGRLPSNTKHMDHPPENKEDPQEATAKGDKHVHLSMRDGWVAVQYKCWVTLHCLTVSYWAARKSKQPCSQVLLTGRQSSNMHRCTLEYVMRQ